MPVSPATAKMSAQLRAAWLYAASRPESDPFTIPVQTKNNGVQLRFKLYNIARPVRIGEKSDPELLAALTKIKISVAVRPDGGWCVMMAHKTEEDDLTAALDAAGVDVPQETPSLVGMYQRLIDAGLMQPAAEPADPFATKNPYYTRVGTGETR